MGIEKELEGRIEIGVFTSKLCGTQEGRLDHMDEGLLIATIEQSAKSEVRVRRVVFHDRDYVDVRKFVLNGRGEWVPTKKDYAIPPDKVGDMIEALRKAEADV